MSTAGGGALSLVTAEGLAGGGAEPGEGSSLRGAAASATEPELLAAGGGVLSLVTAGGLAGGETEARGPERGKRPESAIDTSTRIALPNRIHVTLRRDDVACGVLATVAAPGSLRCADAL